MITAFSIKQSQMMVYERRLYFRTTHFSDELSILVIIRLYT